MGITAVIDNGLPLALFEDAISSADSCIDLVKFGWGTALVTPRLTDKISCLDRHNIGFLFGGTLFEKFFAQGIVEEYFDFCRQHGCRYLEVSDGTIEIPVAEKARLIARAAEDFVVLSEVGYKDQERSTALTGEQWAARIKADLEAGATLVVTEARESGTSGVCNAAGELRSDVIEEIIASGIDCRRLVFEAPTKGLQTFFVTRLGSDVNLANIAPSDVIALRSDTFLHFELERHHKWEVEIGA